MKHTTVNLTTSCLETLHRYYPDTMPTSAKVCAVINDWLQQGCPNPKRYRERKGQQYQRIRIHIPDNIYKQIPDGINLSHTVRTYLTTFI